MFGLFKEFTMSNEEKRQEYERKRDEANARAKEYERTGHPWKAANAYAEAANYNNKLNHIAY